MNLAMIVGRKGSGKSTLLRAIVNYHLDAHKDVKFLVYDRTVEWTARDRVEVIQANAMSFEKAAQRARDTAPVTFVCDELDLYCPNHQGGLRAGSPIHAIVHYGRHEQVALIAAARRSANVHTDVRALADTFFFFQTTEAHDLEWIGKLCGEAWSKAAREIQPYKFLRCDL